MQETTRKDATPEAKLAAAREDIALARSMLSSEALAANGPKRMRYEAALRHIDLAIAEIDQKLATYIGES